MSRPGMGPGDQLGVLGWLLADWVQIMLAWPPPPRQYPAPRYRAALPTLPGRTARPAPAAAAVSGAGPRLSWCREVAGGAGRGHQAASCLSVVRCSARATEAGAGLLLVCWKHADNLGDTAHHHTSTTTTTPTLELETKAERRFVKISQSRRRPLY